MLYTIDLPHHLAFAQRIKQNLAKIGLDVADRGVPDRGVFRQAHGARRLRSSGSRPGRPTTATRTRVLNVQLDGRFIGSHELAALRLAEVQPPASERGSSPGRGPLTRLRKARRAARSRCGADGGDRLSQRSDARLEARRLHRTVLRPRRRLPQVGAHGACTATQTNPPTTAIPAGALPTSIVSYDVVRRGVDP